MEVSGHLHFPATLPPGMGPRLGLNLVARRKYLRPCRESNPGRPAHGPHMVFGTLFQIILLRLIYETSVVR